MGWLYFRLMRTNTATATTWTTAHAVAFGAAGSSYVFPMWSKPAAKHQNKRRSRRTGGFVI